MLPPGMSLIATAADFEQGGLYDPPYHRYPFFDARAATLHGRFVSQKMLVAGCGYGYLVDDLVTAGFDAYGVDASAYAISKGQTLLPAISARLAVADALNGASLDTAGKAFGLKGQQRWPLLVTEDMLTCCSDAEIATALTNLRARATALGHIVTILDTAGEARDARINWKTLADWKQLVAPDVCLDSNGNVA